MRVLSIVPIFKLTMYFLKSNHTMDDQNNLNSSFWCHVLLEHWQIHYTLFVFCIWTGVINMQSMSFVVVGLLNCLHVPCVLISVGQTFLSLDCCLVSINSLSFIISLQSCQYTGHFFWIAVLHSEPVVGFVQSYQHTTHLFCLIWHQNNNLHLTFIVY